MSLIHIQNKWQKRWAEQKAFEVDAQPKKPKFFITFPYPYLNGFSHLGHLFSVVRVDVMARYKRLKGHHVLFPQGWHATGSPIVSAAKLVAQKNEKQLSILADMGIPKSDFAKFETAEYWIEFFGPKFKEDFQSLGVSVDWRREFVTTPITEQYDKFIHWQFNKLKEKGLVKKGKYPVVWDPQQQTVVGDHDRVEGEGETPQEFILVKHKLENAYLITATLRQDTILGITNLYMHPDGVYVRIKTKSEEWIVGEAIVEKLAQQDFAPEIISTHKGVEFIGQKVQVYGKREVLVLPATFLDLSFGTGLVHSVPSDSADDLISLWDLQKDDKTIAKYKLNAEEVKAIQPIPVLNTGEYGDVPAQKFLEKHKIKSQNDREKLNRIREELYKLSYYVATFNHLYKDAFSKNLEGKQVQEGKDFIKEELLKEGAIDIYYQLTGKVISRAKNECVVKIVDNQWFIAYGDPKWKKLAHECLDSMQLYPEKVRQQFDYVLDWLHDWACSREFGLGSKLPWDKSWLIEALSDSTVYMAYYTITHLIKEVPTEKINDELFDIVFNEKPTTDPLIKKMQQEFSYWYPLDLRSSGKDLIQNHLSFFIFNHVALFKKKYWPKGIAANGWITADGKKMSKSLGNFIIIRDAVQKYTADGCRAAATIAGESIDDANWESQFATTIGTKLEQWLTFIKETYNTGRDNMQHIDEWMLSRVAEIVNKVDAAMDQTLFRTAFQSAFFDLNRHIKWYLKRTMQNPNKDVINTAIKAQIVLLSPIISHTCEEAWEIIGQKDFVSTASWPQVKAKKTADTEWFIESTMSDVHAVLRLAKIEKPKKIILFISADWKYVLFETIEKLLQKTKSPKDIISSIMQSNLKQHGQDIMKIVPRIIKVGTVPNWFTKKEEKAVLTQAKAFLEKNFNSTIEIVDANKSDHQKAAQAFPGKVAIVVE